MIREEHMLRTALRQTVAGWREMYGRTVVSSSGNASESERLRSLVAARAAVDVAGELIALAVFAGGPERTHALVEELIGRVHSSSTKGMEDLIKLATEAVKKGQHDAGV